MTRAEMGAIEKAVEGGRKAWATTFAAGVEPTPETVAAFKARVMAGAAGVRSGEAKDELSDRLDELAKAQLATGQSPLAGARIGELGARTGAENARAAYLTSTAGVEKELKESQAKLNDARAAASALVQTKGTITRPDILEAKRVAFAKALEATKSDLVMLGNAQPGTPGAKLKEQKEALAIEQQLALSSIKSLIDGASKPKPAAAPTLGQPISKAPPNTPDGPQTLKDGTPVMVKDGLVYKAAGSAPPKAGTATTKGQYTPGQQYRNKTTGKVATADANGNLVEESSDNPLGLRRSGQ